MTHTAVAPANLKEIVALATRLIMLQGLVDETETSLSDLKTMLRAVQEEDLPLAMKEARLEEFKLETGEKITVKEDMVVGISETNKEQAYKWLEDHGYSSIIGTVVTVEFSKGELEQAQKLLLDLSKKKLNARLTRGVHWQTLKALLIEQVRAKKKIPLDLFGAHPINKATVKLPKK